MMAGRSHSMPRAASTGGSPYSDRLLWFPTAVCAFTLIFDPLSEKLTADPTQLFSQASGGSVLNKVFWILVSAYPVYLALTNWRRIFNSRLAPPLIALFLYLGLAGLSVMWAFKPGISLVRYVQQMMLISALVFPVLLAPRSADLIRRIYLIYAVSAVINLFFVFAGEHTISMNANIGYSGYFIHKNVLGEFAAFTVFLALFGMTQGGGRRLASVMLLVVAAFILVMSKSKTSLALAIALPVLAIVLTSAGRLTRISPAYILFAIVGTVVLAAIVLGISPEDISEKIYGDRTFTSRTEIWDFAAMEIQRRPWFGWGFQSFWLVGPDGPSMTDAIGWVRNMPQAHNGYLDIKLSTGRIGLALIIPFLVLTLIGIGRIAAYDRPRAHLLFSMVIFVIVSNFMESTFLEGHSFEWPTFVLMSVEVARRWRPRMAGQAAAPRDLRGARALRSYRPVRPA